MKFFIINNINIGHNQLEDDDRIVDYFDNYFIPYMQNNYLNNDRIIFLGNLFFSKIFNEHSLKTLIYILDKLSNYNLIIMRGEKDSDYMLKLLNKYNNITIVTEYKIHKIKNKNVLFLPFVDKKDISEILKNNIDFIISSMDYLFHITNISNNFQILQFNRQDKKEFLFKVLDTNDFSICDIHNNYSPIYVNIDVKTIDDLNIDYKNYYSFSIDESLIENRDIKRKIDEIKLNSKNVRFNIIKNNKEYQKINTDNIDIKDIIYSIISESENNETDKNRVKKLINNIITQCQKE